MFNIKDVAKNANVSIATVSNVISGTRRVSDALKNRVLQAVDELGYEIDPLASNMKKKHTQTIGLITTRITSVFYPYVIDGINKVIQAAGYDLVLHDSNDDPELEMKSIKRLTQTRASGIILDTSHNKNNEKYFLELSGLSHRSYRMPIVSIEQDLSRYGLDSVFVDGVEDGIMATKHLIACGCHSIAHITGTFHSSLSQDRLLGYKRALAKIGININNQLIKQGNFSQLSGYTATKELLSNNVLFDGIFAANDQMAAGACYALREQGLKIPDDVRLVGYDNTFIASIVRPSITTVDVPKTEMGYQAAKRLIERIEDVNHTLMPCCIKLSTQLKVRETTDKQAKPDWSLFDW